MALNSTNRFKSLSAENAEMVNESSNIDDVDDMLMSESSSDSDIDTLLKLLD